MARLTFLNNFRICARNLAQHFALFIVKYCKHKLNDPRYSAMHGHVQQLFPHCVLLSSLSTGM